MKIGVFIPIGNNGWLISGNAPQDQPSFALNRQITLTAERYGLDFVLSMIKLRGFGGKTEFWDHNLEFFTLMAGLAATACTDLGNDPPRPCLIPSWPGSSLPDAHICGTIE
jgi:pyrimidine oxygenase